MFIIHVRADEAGKVRYRVETATKNQAALQMIYERAGSEEPERIATTPHHVFRPAGRQRGMNRK
jgi:hypothetical protein